MQGIADPCTSSGLASSPPALSSLSVGLPAPGGFDPCSLALLNPPKGSSTQVVEDAQASHLSLALAAGDRMTPPPIAPVSMTEVAEVLLDMTPAEILALRTSSVERVEALSQSLRQSNHELLETLHPAVAGVLRNASEIGVQVMLLSQPLDEIGWADKDLVPSLTQGFPLSGVIPVDPLAPLHTVRSAKTTPAGLLIQSTALNSKLLDRHIRSLGRTDLQDLAKISALTMADIDLSRCSPASAPPLLDGSLVSRRFPVKQLTSSGAVKIRAIDDLAESQINDTTSVGRRIRMDRTSDLWATARILRSWDLLLSKSDFAAAYRSCPIDPLDHCLSSFLFYLETSPDVFETRVSTQYAMPFGAVGAVYAWDRLGGGVTALLRRLLLLPTGRYVDDLFWIDESSIAAPSRSLVMRFVTALGLQLAADKTPPPSKVMPLLGIQLSVEDIDGVQCLTLLPDPAKLQFWLQCLEEAMSCRIPASVIESLCGRLCFAVFAIWGPSARARLRPLYQWGRAGGSPDASCMSCLHWWKTKLYCGEPTVLFLSPDSLPPVLVYTDAEGRGGIGGLLFDPLGAVEWFRSKVSKSVISLLNPRLTNINALELLAMIVAVRVWDGRLRGRRLVLFVDNTVALACGRKGASRASDLNRLSHHFQLLLRGLGCRVWLYWVPSKLNLADTPSRGEPPLIGVEVFNVPPWTSVSAALTDL